MALPREDLTPEKMMAAFEDSDFEKMEEIRSRIDSVVEDPETARDLKAWYRQLCKRPCFHDEYLDAFNEPGTHLVHTDGKGVERITATAWSPPARSTRSTASSTRRASRWGRSTPAAPATT
jgi:cyclohexanone monooxygenase